VERQGYNGCTCWGFFIIIDRLPKRTIIILKK
jgi:hypothetical protein